MRNTGAAGSDGERLIRQAAAGCQALRGNLQTCTLVAFCALGTALGASFAVAALIRELGLADALLIVGFGFSAIAGAGLRPLIRTERLTAGAAAIPEPSVSIREHPVPPAPTAS